MDALVSGVAARVVFISGSQVSYIDADRPNERYNSTRAELPHLLADAHDVELLSATTEKQAFGLLLTKWNSDRALRMLQIALDSDEELASRHEAARYFTALVSAPEVQSAVENAAFSIAFPESATSENLEVSLTDSGLLLLEKLRSHQQEIEAVRRAWDALPNSIFSGNRCKAELTAITTGAFRALAEGLKEETLIAKAVSNCYFKLKSQANYRDIVHQWTVGFADKQVRRKAKKHAVLRDLLEEDSEFQVPSWPESPVHQKYQNVSRQKAGVIEQLEKGNDGRARLFVEQLIAHQLQSGAPIYASKSLCALAQEARRLGNSTLQLEWVVWATKIVPEDGWAHGQAADAYFAMSRFNEAYVEYEAAARFGMGRRGETGQAKVLAATGHLDDALTICRTAIAKYADDPEVHSSRAQYAEILRGMWRLEDALDAYEQAIDLHPDQTFLRCGRAAVLTDMSRFTDALKAYDGIISHFPNDLVALCGRANVLKELGELNAALDAYDDVIAGFQNEPIPAFGRADVLRSMGLLDDALHAYRLAKARFPFEPTAYSGIGEVLRELENIDAALDAYEEAKERFPHDCRIRNGYANMLRHGGRFKEALSEYDRIVRDFRYDIASLSGRANMLKALGSYDSALQAYDEVLAHRPDHTYSRYAKAAIYVAQGHFDKALGLLPEHAPRTYSDWVAFHIEGMIHLRKGDYATALEIFTQGAHQTPFFNTRRYFNTALAATKLRLGLYQEALEHVQHINTALSHVLMMHSYAALGEIVAAKQEFEAVNDNALPPLVALRDEIAAHFQISGRVPAQNATWLLDQESQVLLQAA